MTSTTEETGTSATEINPEEKLQTLRRIIFTNGLNNTACIEKYFELFDNSEKGFNNYADEILSAVKNLNNVSHLWESVLDSKKIINQTFKNTVDSSSVQIKITDEIRQQATCLSTQAITIESRKKLLTHSNKVPENDIRTFTFKSLNTPTCTNLPGSLSYGNSENLNSVFRMSSRYDLPNSSYKHKQASDSHSDINLAISNTESLSFVSPKANQVGWSRERIECPFRTAKDQLEIEVRKKNQNNINSPQIAGLYGSNKKSLGTRKGVWNDFVAPIPGSKVTEQNLKNIDNCPQINTNPSNRSGSGKYEAIISHDSLKQFEAGMIESLLNEIMDLGKVVTWDDIAGLELPKKILQEIVMLPMMRPDIFTGIRAPAKGLLLFGPPGTGKTLIGKCIASQSKSTFFSISASSLTSKWVGQGEKMVRIMFIVARLFQPAVIFIDEIDSLLSQRNETEHESSRKIKTEFLVQMDGVGTGETEKLLLMGATNRPQEIDEAARRRFVKRVYIPLPSTAARKQIIQNTLRHELSHISSDQLDDVVRKSEGFSGADMTNLCKEAAMGPIRNVPHDQLVDISLNDVPPIQFEHFCEALNNVKSSVSSDDIDQYVKWNNIYGSSIKQQ